MSKKTPKDTKPKDEMAAVELEPDAWERFERFIKKVAQVGPKHRPTPKAKERPASKGRIHKGKSRA